MKRFAPRIITSASVVVLLAVVAATFAGSAAAWDNEMNLQSPAVGATLSSSSPVSFAWSASPYGDAPQRLSYQIHFQVASDPGFPSGSLVVDRTSTCYSPAGCPSTSTEGPFPVGTYYWRVTSSYMNCIYDLAAHGTVGGGGSVICRDKTSDIHSFTAAVPVAPPPTTPTPPTPVAPLAPPALAAPPATPLSAAATSTLTRPVATSAVALPAVQTPTIAPAASSTPTAPLDTQAPHVTALAVKGVHVGQTMLLRYRVSDNSGKASTAITVYHASHLAWQHRVIQPVASKQLHSARWTPKHAGAFNVCILATDASGNISRTSCATALVRAS
jgi:hypothetical protein